MVNEAILKLIVQDLRRCLINPNDFCNISSVLLILIFFEKMNPNEHALGRCRQLMDEVFGLCSSMLGQCKFIFHYTCFNAAKL